MNKYLRVASGDLLSFGCRISGSMVSLTDVEILVVCSKGYGNLSGTQ